MKTVTRSLLFLVLAMQFSLAVAADTYSAAAGRVAENQTVVPRWQPCDFVFAGSGKPADPFKQAFSASVKGPGNVEFRIPGYYDGDGKWNIRVSATTEGEWSIETQSDLPELNGKVVRFQCGPNPNQNVHGALRVDPQYRRHFVFEDGTRYFLSGYECDWLWALGQCSGSHA